MKKIIYIAIILFFASLTILFLKSKERQPEKLTIQTELYPVQVNDEKKINSPGRTRTIWVQAKNKKAKNISFYVDAVTVDAIVERLKSPNKNYLDNYKNKKPINFTWLVEKSGTTTFLKLIHFHD